MDEKEDMEPRQIVVATAIITSLVTYFTTSQLISMSSDDDEDDLFESTNHLIAAIKNHETRLVRLEAQQDQLRKHLEKLTNALVMGIRTQDIFFDMFAMATYANFLSRHVREINDGLYTLLHSSKLHPKLINWSELAKALDKLRKKAVQNSKELLLQNNADISQLQTDFVAHPKGIIHILVHIPIVDISSKLKLLSF